MEQVKAESLALEFYTGGQGGGVGREVSQGN